VGLTAGVKPANDGETILEQLALTVAEACAAARIGRTTLYEAIKNGDLVAAKYGRKTLIRVDDLRSWLGRLPTIGPNVPRDGAPVQRHRQRRV
jgi:excisionase family DNA binding protein